MRRPPLQSAAAPTRLAAARPRASDRRPSAPFAFPARPNRRAWLAVAGLFMAVDRLEAQPVLLMERPRPIELHIEHPTLSLEVEGTRLDTIPSDGPASSDDTLDWRPVLGLRFEGSIYHAKLFQFDIQTEDGLTEGTRRLTYGDGRVDDEDRHFVLQRYHASATLLRDKPYSASFFGSKNREERDYDQFNRFDADTETYGAAARGAGPNWNWNLRYEHHDERVADSERPSAFRDDVLSLDSTYRGGRGGQTLMHYTDQSFRRQDDGTPAYDGVQRTFYAIDEANCGPSRDDRLDSSLSISDLNETFLDSRVITLRESLRHQQRPNLWDGALYQYDHREGNGTDGDLHNAEVYVEHRLDDRLDSRLDFQGEHGEGQSDTFTRLGPGLAEGYRQQLNPFSRVNIDLSGRWDHIVRSTPGQVVTVMGENVRLDDSRPSFLAMPNVRLDTVVVTGNQGTRRFLEGLDYRLIPRGSVTELQRVFGGAIPNGSSVSVDYVADAGGSESLNLLTRRTAIEFDLYDRLLFLYAEQRAAENLNGQSEVYQSYQDTVLGLKNRWSWLELGAEHVDHTADTFSYGGVNYYADAFWNGDHGSARLHAARSILDYRDQAGGLDTRTYTATLSWAPARDVTFQGFAGQRNEDTLNGQRNLLTLEGRMMYRCRRLLIDAAYRYENEALSKETYERRHFLVRLVRDL